MIPSLSRVYTALLVESHLHFYLTPNVTYRIYVVGTYGTVHNALNIYLPAQYITPQNKMLKCYELRGIGMVVVLLL